MITEQTSTPKDIDAPHELVDHDKELADFIKEAANKNNTDNNIDNNTDSNMNNSVELNSASNSALVDDSNDKVNNAKQNEEKNSETQNSETEPAKKTRVKVSPSKKSVTAKTAEKKPLSKTAKKKRARKNTPGPNKTRKKMTAAEKIRIFEGVKQGKSAYKLADELGRTIPAITKVMRELAEFAQASLVSDDGLTDGFVPCKDYLDTDGYNRVVTKLNQNGLSRDVAHQRISKIMNSAQANNIDVVAERELFKVAMATMAGTEVFIQKTSGGQKVATSNKAASERGDLASKNRPSSNITDHIDGQRIFKI